MILAAGGHVSDVSLSLRIKAIYQSAGIKTSSQSGRRTFATRLNAAGIGMRTIQNAIGQANIQTTALYCDVTDDQLANAFNAA
jgi:integrase/recombinase XerD